MPGPMNTCGGGMNFAFPDVCLTPVPPVGSPAPIPYPNTAQLAMSDPSTKVMSIMADSMPSCNLLSEVTMSNGNEAGIMGGAVSGVFMGESSAAFGSTSVFLEGAPAQTLAGPTSQNGMMSNTFGITTVPSQASVLVMS